MENNNKILLKRLLYRSLHRGCKETDILLGKFALQRLENFNEEKLHLYRDFIEEDDLAIYNWLVDKQDSPDKYSNLVVEIKQFHKI